MAIVHTIGLSTRSVEDFISLLREAGVDRLLDVRKFPCSKWSLHFNNDAFPGDLQAADTAYHHVKALGRPGF